MWQSFGARNSSVYHDTVLANWSRLAGVNIGRPYYAGWALFVDITEDDYSVAFVIEHRGSGFPPFHMRFPFRKIRTRQGFGVDDRRYAFEEAVTIYRRLSKQDEI